MSLRRLTVSFVALLALLIAGCLPAFAQSTIASGSIQGTVTDPQGAAVPGAKITITSADTGKVISLESTSAGAYNAGTMEPGNYVVRVEATNFKTTTLAIVVQVGNISTGNVKLELGASSTVVEVAAEAVAVNTDQAQVGGVLTTAQIENLPTNGRNFLDLAQLEPGVQIQDGSGFDPTKAGFSSISFGGRFGRTARIEVDGVDVSDETVGTTTEDIPSSAIQEFQLSQSSLDLSNELTSSGAVNVVTRSGTNTVHGEAYGQYRNSDLAARLPGPVAAPFERSQWGGNVGGPIIKDKFFFFLDGERTINHLAAPVVLPSPFTALSGTASSPFHELDTVAKADYQATKSLHLFYRFSYFQNFTNSFFQGSSYSPYANKDRTRNHVVGADFTTGQFTHSFRFEYLKFQNNISDTVLGSSLPFANLGVEMSVSSLLSGPNFLAPQETPQSDHQFKYDGSKIWGSHIIRYGVAYNHIQGGGYADFFGIQPEAINVFGASTNPAFPNAFTDPNPLDYVDDVVVMGNNQGFSTNEPAFGFKNGGLGPDNRVGAYVGDSWKIKPNVTLTYGVRYVRDTGRTDSDLNTLQVLNNYIPGIGDPVQQPNKNFGPQVGLAWDPWNNGKTVIRAGIGEYFENVIYNNVLFDRPLRLTTGDFLYTPESCFFGTAEAVNVPGGTRALPSSVCNESIGDAASTLNSFQKSLQAAYAGGATGPNPSYLGSRITGAGAIPTGLYAPDYKTPRSIQMNVGVQRQIAKNTVLSVDYLRNVSLHYLLSVDVNHSGDVSYFSPTNAQGAVASTLAACGVGSVNAAIASCPGLHPGGGGANIGDFAGFGLDSAADLGANNCAAAIGQQCAFTGTNPNVGAMPLLEPIGRGLYNGLDFKLTQNIDHPFTGLKHANLEVSYTYSRFENDGGASATAPSASATADQDFVITSMDNRNPQKYFGPSTLDRTNQLNFGGYFDLPLWFRVGFVGHFWSALPTTLFDPGSGTGAIYNTDYDGDGSTQDPLPGTHLGSFGRGISAGQLAGVVNNFNSTEAGKFTPAGNTLISNGIFTAAQLSALGGTIPAISPVVANNIGLGDMKAFDLKLSWEGRFWNERLVIEPSAALYNIFNFANYDSPLNELSGLLNGQPGVALNAVTKNGLDAHTNQIGVGTGVFSQGAPRVAEFGLKLTF